MKNCRVGIWQFMKNTPSGLWKRVFKYCGIEKWFNSPGSHPGERRFKSGSRNHDFLKKGGSVETAVTGLSAITGAVSTLTTVVGDVFQMITSNPLLCVFAAAGLVSVGITVFCKLKRSAR